MTSFVLVGPPRRRNSATLRKTVRKPLDFSCARGVPRGARRGVCGVSEGRNYLNLRACNVAKRCLKCSFVSSDSALTIKFSFYL